MVMARKQVLVQLDDDLVARLDDLAAHLGTNRSDLLRRGAETVLRAADDAAADRALVEAYRRHPPEAELLASAAALAPGTVPPW